MNCFSTAEAARLVGVDCERLRTWWRSGFITPSAAPPQGRGRRVLYTRGDLALLRVVHALGCRGFSAQQLRRMVPQLRRVLHGATEDQLLVVGDDTAQVVSRDELIEALGATRRRVALLPLDIAVRGLGTERRPRSPT